MKKYLLGSLGVLILSLTFVALPARADSVGPITFEPSTYTVGNINGQNGWSKTGSYDVNVINNGGVPTSFGTQSLQISNAVTSGSFGDQTFAPAVSTPAGESGANNGTFGPATPVSHFESSFDIYAIPGSTGDNLSVSPDRGDGARMSYLRFENPGDNLIHVYFDDVTDSSHVINADTFNETQIATLDPSVPHTIKFSMDLLDGPDNDVVNIYVDNTLVHTGTSWEDYYRYDSESNPSNDVTYVPTVRTMLFRESGTAVPANSGKGYLIDNLSLSSSTPAPTPSVTTNTADTITTTTATVHGTNGPVAADNTSFWWGTTPITETLVPGTNPGGSEFPATGWTHDNGLGSVSTGTSFSEALTSLTPSTTYYFVAWVQVGGIWYPGQVLSFETQTAVLPTVITDPATSVDPTTATLNGTDGPVAGDNTSFWWGTTPITGTLVSGADPASTNEFPAGWNHDSGIGSVSANGTFNEPLTSLTQGTEYYFVAWVQVDGIWYPGQVLAFATDISPTAVATCPANTTPTLLETVPVDSSSPTPTASINSLTSGQPYLLTSSGTWQNGGSNVADTEFASIDGWVTHMLGYNIAPYLLGPREFQLQVDNQFVPWGSYESSHTYSYLYTGTGNPVNLGVFDGDSTTLPTATSNPDWYGDNSGTLSVAVYSCTPTTGSLTVTKEADGGDNTFTFTTTGPTSITPFTITTTSGSGSQTFNNLTPGTYTVTEGTNPHGWTQTDTECSNVSVTAGGATFCTITDTNNKLLGEIRGTKYEDRDGDGKLTDGDHHRLSGITITLTNSSNAVIATTTTDRYGNYHFGSLVAGTYHVSETIPSGWIETYPSTNTYTINLSAGQIAKKKDFGNFHLGTISGIEYNDLNADGREESNESGLSGWTVTLSGSNHLTTTTTTGANGNYSFTGLKAGVYTLTETTQSGWTETDHPNKVLIQSGTVSKNDNFGNTQKIDKGNGHGWGPFHH